MRNGVNENRLAKEQPAMAARFDGTIRDVDKANAVQFLLGMKIPVTDASVAWCAERFMQARVLWSIQVLLPSHEKMPLRAGTLKDIRDLAFTDTFMKGLRNDE